MPIRERPLSGQPSLRYLKLEAKRRLAAGEFETLHDAQLAVAREYGQPSWAALKRFVAAPAATGNPALAQLRWVIARFENAGSPGWTPPGDNELREHFDDTFLAAVPADRLVSMITSAGPAWRGDVAVTAQTAHAVRARIGCLDVTASAAPDPPHRIRRQLTGLRALVLGGLAADPAPPRRRRAAPAARCPPGPRRPPMPSGRAGLPGVVLAGGSPGGRQWALAAGWADLDRERYSRRATGSRPLAYPGWSLWSPYCGSWRLGTSVSTARLTTTCTWCGWPTTPLPSGSCSPAPAE